MACANSRILIWVNHLEVMPALVAFFKLNVNLLVRRDHIVLQVPPGASAELRDDDVAVAEEIDIEVDVGHGRARDVDLRDVRREVGYHLGHGGDLEMGPSSEPIEVEDNPSDWVDEDMPVDPSFMDAMRDATELHR